jgi:hypothetical protein
VKRKTLIADYKDGGLKMLDIESFIKAQKAMWVKRLTDPQTGSWKTYPMKMLQKLIGNDSFGCSLGKQDITKANLTDFYKQVLESWTEIRNIALTNPSKQDIRNECLWLNQNIKIRNQTLLWNDWRTKGINCINDILNEDGTFINYAELTEKMGQGCDFMKFNSLKDSIPKKWREALKNNSPAPIQPLIGPPPYIKINKVSKGIQKCKNQDLYWILVVNKQIQPIIKEKWSNKLGINLTDKDWNEIFTIPRVVRDTKLRAFQYKVLYNLIICKAYLNKIGKADTDLCDKCNQPDLLTHFLYDCNETKNFWINFSTWWENTTQETILITRNDTILGLLNASDTLNACVLFAKWFIYREKINNRNTFFYKFQFELKYRLDAEKLIAIKNNNLDKYYAIWRIIELVLVDI